ncbi:MAG TPA: hypothetical protein VHJ40_02335, partial [Actinomycetota bacterium]|nr:hypothetical protein [Actinomycetota bacterium]
SCTLCGYPGTAPGERQADLKHTDYVVVDPFLWDWSTKEPPRPPIRGHSTYATAFHERFEEHLKAIARQAYGAQ